ncbi:hypothetical protein GCM10009678_51910 [Actinomadura kijaniata]|uniref:DUF397 domain-containing protein n=1 Tax=Actinomadura namibiensis TaxID=182080 RepID=A0A7W3LKX2_ACTNM|nr:DUF397 domain-containing protein [Actinomadura namibiensis]MBA8950030.1 hypothetical protein [Actinomadura namibiensis]
MTTQPPARAFGRIGFLRLGERTQVVRWLKSSASVDSECVEVTAFDATCFVRDSTDVEGPVVPVPAASWAALRDAIRERG